MEVGEPAEDAMVDTGTITASVITAMDSIITTAMDSIIITDMDFIIITTTIIDVVTDRPYSSTTTGRTGEWHTLAFAERVADSACGPFSFADIL